MQGTSHVYLLIQCAPSTTSHSSTKNKNRRKIVSFFFFFKEFVSSLLAHERTFVRRPWRCFSINRYIFVSVTYKMRYVICVWCVCVCVIDKPPALNRMCIYCALFAIVRFCVAVPFNYILPYEELSLYSGHLGWNRRRHLDVEIILMDHCLNFLAQSVVVSTLPIRQIVRSCEWQPNAVSAPFHARIKLYKFFFPSFFFITSFCLANVESFTANI